MCLILLAINSHPQYPLVIAANRDEFYARPTKTMHWWQEAPRLLAGQDRQNGGTWFGLTRNGRLAAVTNYREGGASRPDRPSRGILPRDYLLESRTEWNGWLQQNAFRFNGFNLLFGNWNALHWYSNRSDQTAPTRLEDGIHGLSNSLLDTPWPKVQRGRRELTELVQRPDFNARQLLELLQDDTPGAPADLPDTGIGEVWEELLSPVFIRSDTYGTRASTALLIDRQQQARVIERSWSASGHFKDRQFQFSLQH